MEDETERKTPEEILAEASEAKKNRWLAIFLGLADCPEYVAYVNDNFDISTEIDDVAKTITTTVIQKPVKKGPKLSPKQLASLHATCMSAGVMNTHDLVVKIINILDGDAPSIMLATESDIKKLVS